MLLKSSAIGLYLEQQQSLLYKTCSERAPVLSACGIHVSIFFDESASLDNIRSRMPTQLHRTSQIQHQHPVKYSISIQLQTFLFINFNSSKFVGKKMSAAPLGALPGPMIAVCSLYTPPTRLCTIGALCLTPPPHSLPHTTAQFTHRSAKVECRSLRTPLCVLESSDRVAANRTPSQHCTQPQSIVLHSAPVYSTALSPSL